MIAAHRNSRHAGNMAEAARYFLVVVFGLGIDTGVAFAAHHLLRMPLVADAAIGFVTGVAVNYVLFEYWVFQTGTLTWQRLGKAYSVACGAFVVRLITVLMLGHVLAGMPQSALVTLVAAAGVSFAVNFVFVRLLLRKT